MSLCASLLVGASASAAGLTKVTAAWNGGTTEPNYITMYEYIPTKVVTNPPILVVVHYCGGSANGIYGEAQGGGIISAADAQGFIMIFPQLDTSRNCWDVATTASLTHATGTASGGDTKAIVDMVNYEIKTRSANAARVYSIGSSSGAMMTEALLAVYPDVFKGGSEFAGVPAGCWSDQYASSNQWSGPCAGGTNTMTAAAWGTLVKNMYPGYSGFRPRIQLWHGSADTTISPTNQTEAIKEWTNVLNLPTAPTTTTTVTISSHSYTRQQWNDAACGQTLLDAWTESNGPHGTDANMNAQYSLPFFALDKAPFAATDPQVACSGGTGTGGSTGTGGTGTGTGGSTGTGGMAGAKGTGGMAGAKGTGGTTGTGGTGTTGGAGTTGTGGTGTGGTGTTGTGGTGTTGTGGTSTTGTGGVNGAGGNSSTGGVTGTGTGGSDTSGTGGEVGVVTPAPAGCACDVASTSGGLNVLALLAGIFVVAFSRRRTKRSSNA
jgi:poly(hydroxyalkanoate) depolymerase family esterase